LTVAIAIIVPAGAWAAGVRGAVIVAAAVKVLK
jgi:hypothetical protein